jgi:hypothetical protein
MIDVPAAMATTVKTANQTAVDILEAIPEGSSVSFSADQLAFLFSTDERIGPVSEAHARVEHFARARGCSFLFRQQAGTGTFTKEKRTPKTALRAATTDCLDAPQTNILPALLTRRIRELPSDAEPSAANSSLQSRPVGRFEELERKFHPEWGFLAPRRSFRGTFRVVLIASAIGALSGGGTVLWMKGGATDATESVAARTLAPPEVEVFAKPSEATSSGLPPQQHIPLEASEPNTPQTSAANRQGDTAGPEADATLPARQPNAVQVESPEPRDHAPGAGEAELGSVASRSRQAPNIASPSPTVHAKSPQMAGRLTSEREPVHKKVKPEIVERKSNQRDARNGDSVFFRPWWYADPASGRHRNPG